MQFPPLEPTPPGDIPAPPPEDLPGHDLPGGDDPAEEPDDEPGPDLPEPAPEDIPPPV